MPYWAAICRSSSTRWGGSICVGQLSELDDSLVSEVQLQEVRSLHAADVHWCNNLVELGRKSRHDSAVHKEEAPSASHKLDVSVQPSVGLLHQVEHGAGVRSFQG